jgi:hypothetical protein
LGHALNYSEVPNKQADHYKQEGLGESPSACLFTNKSINKLGGIFCLLDEKFSAVVFFQKC